MFQWSLIDGFVSKFLLLMSFLGFLDRLMWLFQFKRWISLLLFLVMLSFIGVAVFFFFSHNILIFRELKKLFQWTLTDDMSAV